MADKFKGHDDSHQNIKVRRFPMKMFVVAGICSLFMMTVISTVYSQTNTPCYNSPFSEELIVVNTGKVEEPILHASSRCNRNNQQISWITWVFDRSESIQFHYLDLIELISRK